MKAIFITGATGAIGSRLIPELLKDNEVYLKLLIRAASQEGMQKRLDYILDFWDINRHEESVINRIEGFQGDITFENLGLGGNVYETLSKQVTHIIHCATNIKLMLTLEEARKYTLEGTKNILKFAKRCIERGQFKRFNYLSTMEVAGTMKGIVPENFISQKRSFLNTYEIAKAETENLLQGLSKEGFPLTIYRPSMVVGDSATGKAITFQFFYHLLEDAFLSPSSPILPFRPEWRFDIVPVDFVARAICAIYDKPETNGKIYNIVTGADFSIPSRALFTELKNVLEKLTGKQLKSPREIPPQIGYTILSILSIFSYGAAKKKIKFQQMLTRFLLLNQRFENSRTKTELTRAGITIPKISDYLYTIGDYYLKNRKN